MQKVLVVSLVLVLLLVGGAAAQSFEISIDGLAGVGVGRYKDSVAAQEKDTRDFGLALNASVEVYPKVAVEGQYLLGNALRVKDKDSNKYEELAKDTGYSVSTLLVGAKYRVIEDAGMSAYLGAGYTKGDSKINIAKEETVKLSGSGIYGKLGLVFEVVEDVEVIADVAYAPKAKFTSTVIVDKETTDIEGSILALKAGVVYRFSDNLGVQVGFAKNGIKAEVEKGYNGDFSSGLIGAGVVVNF